MNRSLERAKELAQELNLLAGRELAKPVALADYRSVPKDSYLAVQTTSVGMSPKADAAPVEDREFYSMIHTGFDAVYTPAETKFMRYIKDAGGKACNGLMMLLYQGVIGYELWNPGVTVRPETVEEAKGKSWSFLGGDRWQGRLYSSDLWERERPAWDGRWSGAQDFRCWTRTSSSRSRRA